MSTFKKVNNHYLNTIIKIELSYLLYYFRLRHMWALKGLYKSVTKLDPPETERE